MDEKELYLFDYAFCGANEGFAKMIDYLASIAEEEKWSFDGESNSILLKYIKGTFKQCYAQNKILVSDDGEYSCFNTGLLTENGNDIVAMFTKNDRPDAQEWYMLGFRDITERQFLNVFSCTPEIATYTENYEELYFNPDYPIVLSTDHILDDNWDRIKEVVPLSKSIVKGLLVVGAIYFVITLLEMQASTYLFKTLLGDFIIVLIILFTPEIRHALETMGRRNFAFLNFFGAQQGDAMYERKKRSILEICKACNDMSEKKIGALIVFERNTMLGDVIKTGTNVDAKVSRELVGSLFFPNSPLHDGGVVIRDGRVNSAGCILPLTKNNDLSKNLGTRHRAAVGISENSDAVAIVVSEETGNISIALNGVLKTYKDINLFEKDLNHLLINNSKI